MLPCLSRNQRIDSRSRDVRRTCVELSLVKSEVGHALVSGYSAAAAAAGVYLEIYIAAAPADRLTCMRTQYRHTVRTHARTHTHTHTHTMLILALLHRRYDVVNINVLVVEVQCIFPEKRCRSRADISAYSWTYGTHALQEAVAHLPLCCLLTRHRALGRKLFAAPMDGKVTRGREGGRD